MRVFNQGKVLSPGDLGLNVRDSNGQLIDPTEIAYSIFSQDKDDVLRLVSPPKFAPVRHTTGVYFVSGHIPSDFDGKYRLIWYLKQYPDTDEVQLFEEFEVIRLDPASTSFEAPSVLVVPRPALNKVLAEMVVGVRELLGDENPERNYRFVPPASGRIVAGFNDRVGFLFEDKTIIRMLRLTIAKLNTWNPMAETDYTPENAPKAWREAIQIGAAASCLGKEAAIWAVNEFSYSLNGLSLDLHKAQTYQAMASDLRQEFETWAPLITANRPTISGLRQQRWLLG